MTDNIKKYTKKDGSTAYMFNAYLGMDPLTGKKKRTTRRNFKTKAAAKKELKKIVYDASIGKTKKKEINLTFQQVYEEWFDTYKNTVQDSTWYKRQRMFETRLLPEFGKYKINMITTAKIQTALNKWFRETKYNYKPWFNYTNSIFKYAILQRYITDNPATRVIMPKHKEFEEELPNFWSKDQLITFFRYIDPNKDLEKYTLFRVLAFTGIRRGELLALQWNDFDSNKKILHINKTLSMGENSQVTVHAPKTRKGKRDIYLDNTTIKYLKRWRLKDRTKMLMQGMNIDEPEQLIFHTFDNKYKSFNTPRRWLVDILDKIHKDNVDLPDITLHGFRHTHASALFSAGATVKEVQERLGHEDAQTTLNIYVHVTQQQDEEVAQKLVNYLNF